jgi:hypothetical protein
VSLELFAPSENGDVSCWVGRREEIVKIRAAVEKTDLVCPVQDAPDIDGGEAAG